MVHEIFFSLQGETSHVGLPYAFVRLTGCDLRCTYCDTAHAFYDGSRKTVDEILASLSAYPTRHVLITGGEPLLQNNLSFLIEALLGLKYLVSIETHGEAPLTRLGSTLQKVRIVMDIKTPDSKVKAENYLRNLALLKPQDEIKFVIASENDYAWVKKTIQDQKLESRNLFFSPALPAKDRPGEFPGVSPQWLAEQMLQDGLQARFQMQLHKTIWGADRKGV